MKPYLQCRLCGKIYPIESIRWQCECKGILDIEGYSMFPKDILNTRPWNFWRYSEALAVLGEVSADSRENPMTLGEVVTPIIPVNFRSRKIFCKAEYLLPTGSYKDRGIAACIKHLSLSNVKKIAEDSSGNAGASTAAYAAAAGIQADIYVPDYTSPAKIRQIAFYGAACHKIKGTRTDSSYAAQNAKGAVYIGHSWNPFFIAAVKSIAYEIAEQFHWKLPDAVVTPLGGGGLLLGLIRGFRDLWKAGYIDKIPHIFAVQAEQCNPIFRAWQQGEDAVSEVKLGKTCAEGIALPNPIRGEQVLSELRQVQGEILDVNEQEILSAWKDIAKAGIFVEPTSAAALAGMHKAKASALFSDMDQVLVILTGNGLKSKSVLME